MSFPWSNSRKLCCLGNDGQMNKQWNEWAHTNNIFSISVILFLRLRAYSLHHPVINFRVDLFLFFFFLLFVLFRYCECAIHSSDSIQQIDKANTNHSPCEFRVQRKPSISIAMAFIPLLKIPFTILFISTKETKQQQQWRSYTIRNVRINRKRSRRFVIYIFNSITPKWSNVQKTMNNKNKNIFQWQAIM